MRPEFGVSPGLEVIFLKFDKVTRYEIRDEWTDAMCTIHPIRDGWGGGERISAFGPYWP